MSNQHSGEQSESMDPAPQPSLCSNNCGFFSNPSCNGMCSICYRDFVQKRASQEEAKLVKSPVVEAPPPAQTLSQHSPTPPSPSLPTAGSPLLSIPPPNATGGRLTSPPLPTYSPSPAAERCAQQHHQQQRGDGAEVPAGGLSQAQASAPVSEGRGRKRRPARCFVCSKKVGLVGFTCRCGEQFCEAHRYPEAHQCTFDHKAVERQRIQEENPVIRSERVKRV